MCIWKWERERKKNVIFKHLRNFLISHRNCERERTILSQLCFRVHAVVYFLFLFCFVIFCFSFLLHCFFCSAPSSEITNKQAQCNTLSLSHSHIAIALIVLRKMKRESKEMAKCLYINKMCMCVCVFWVLGIWLLLILVFRTHNPVKVVSCSMYGLWFSLRKNYFVCMLLRWLFAFCRASVFAVCMCARFSLPSLRFLYHLQYFPLIHSFWQQANINFPKMKEKRKEWRREKENERAK